MSPWVLSKPPANLSFSQISNYITSWHICPQIKTFLLFGVFCFGIRNRRWPDQKAPVTDSRDNIYLKCLKILYIRIWRLLHVGETVIICTLSLPEAWLGEYKHSLYPRCQHPNSKHQIASMLQWIDLFQLHVPMVSILAYTNIPWLLRASSWKQRNSLCT